MSQCGNRETSWADSDTKLQNQSASVVILLGLKSHRETKSLLFIFQFGRVFLESSVEPNTDPAGRG